MTNNFQTIFQSPYNDTQWAQTIGELVGAKPDAVHLLRDPEPIDIPGADLGRYLGALNLADGTQIGLFAARLADGSVARRRVGLRRLIAPFSRNGSFDAVFSVFYDDSGAWRFSFVCDMKGAETSAKRFTYVFGDPKEQYRTPVERFAKLRESEITLDAIREAFSVEALTKEFFRDYTEIYQAFCAFVIAHKADPDWFDFAAFSEKDIRDYVKLTLGRIVFLCFLQKKGWMACDKDWKNGNTNFLGNLFAAYCKQMPPDKCNFLDDVLEGLFFECLNQNRKDNFYDTKVKGIGRVRIPYLNGGLFAAKPIDAPKSRFPRELWGRLFDLFARFNFTIVENDPTDAEIGVDPEMLGKIFESQLEDNKDKGAFYTPKEIVSYMCKESIKAYLASTVSQHLASVGSVGSSALSENSALASQLAAFVATHTVPADWSSETRAAVAAALREVKICDPAIGSGAFPMGLLTELCAMRLELEGATQSPADLKREILSNNIYGVDIEQGAIDIARLRFWLALVVDEETPSPLPNLDFKIMQGNSLLESYLGVDLSQLARENTQRIQGNLFGNTYTQLTLISTDDDLKKRELIALKKEYFACSDHRRKDEIKAAIKANIESRLAITNVSFKGLDPTATDQFFLWHTWFGEVFDQGGFDIVIGNPPYGAKVDDKTKAFFKTHYESAKTRNGVKGSTDTFVIFIEHGHSLLRNGGNLAFIVPMSVTSSDAMQALHNVIESDCSEIKVSTYSNRPVQIFESAGLRVAIMQFTRDGKQMERLFTSRMNRRTSESSIQKVIDDLRFTESSAVKMPGRYPKVGSPMEVAILRKCFGTGKTVLSFADEKGKPFYYRTSGGRYWNTVTNYPTGSSQDKPYPSRFPNLTGLVLSSSAFFFYEQVYTDGLHIKQSEIDGFPLPDFDALPKKKVAEMEALYAEYLADIERNANVRTSSGTSSYNVAQFKEYKIVRSKPIIDRINDLICPLYGLTEEETDFIKNYELEFRMRGAE